MYTARGSTPQLVRGLYLSGNAAVRPILTAFLEPFQDLGAANLTLV